MSTVSQFEKAAYLPTILFRMGKHFPAGSVEKKGFCFIVRNPGDDVIADYPAFVEKIIIDVLTKRVYFDLRKSDLDLTDFFGVNIKNVDASDFRSGIYQPVSAPLLDVIKEIGFTAIYRNDV